MWAVATKSQAKPETEQETCAVTEFRCRAGGSDKYYLLVIRPVGQNMRDAWTVEAHFGRTGTKGQRREWLAPSGAKVENKVDELVRARFEHDYAMTIAPRAIPYGESGEQVDHWIASRRSATGECAWNPSDAEMEWMP